MSKINISALTSGQKRALDSMLAGGNVFLTGEAGTGKSVVTEIFIEKSTRDGKIILVTAPTGTAADNLHGETIHRCFGADIGVQKNNRALSSRKDILRAADIVIIDEISMCRFDLFDYVARRILYENECRAKDREFTKIRHTSVIQEGDKTYSVS
jgi:ATP-dependent exoDNAse (exonuclease V) alpha subunit